MANRLTAMDIEKQSFRTRLRGFDPDDVKLFLKAVGEEVERLNLDNARLHEECGELRELIADYRAREQTLQATLVTAQRMSEELNERGRAQSELLVREARLKAERVLQQSQDQLARLESEIAARKIERDGFERRLRALIEEHLALLELREPLECEPDNLRDLHVVRRAGSDVG
ncbi:MAG TPA: DivIVA domain-containing protein [Candidatus Polarisedimenticolaceae bacterium]|nr:DivIVA domain-containing protein [Candidatus Polarisedimenticolaceae bacterium]